MRKFKIDKNVSRKFVAFMLIGTISLTGLTGCGSNSKQSFLSGTALEDAKVISFEDGHRDMAVIESIGCNSGSCDCQEKMYKSIVTNEYFADDECVSPKWNYNLGSSILNHYNIINSESIISYLTSEEIVKAYKEGLTDEDITNIINRIFINEETTEKVK